MPKVTLRQVEAAERALALRDEAKGRVPVGKYAGRDGSEWGISQDIIGQAIAAVASMASREEADWRPTETVPEDYYAL